MADAFALARAAAERRKASAPRKQMRRASNGVCGALPRPRCRSMATRTGAARTK